MTFAYDVYSKELQEQPQNWLVTGVAGFIGSHLAQRLIELGQNVTGVDNFSTGFPANIEFLKSIDKKGSFQFHEGDITDLDLCQKLCKGKDRILHQAAVGSVPRSIHDPLTSHNSNVNGMLNLLIAARDNSAQRFVFASSSSVYGDSPGLPKVEDQMGNPLSPYACTKLFDEHYASQFFMHYGLPIVGLRYFNVFGPRQSPDGAYAAVIPKWIAALIAEEPVFINGDGTNSRDFCFVENVIQANLLASLAPADIAANHMYNVACESRTDLNTLYQLLRDSLAVKFPKLKDAQPTHRDPREGDIPHSLASVEKAREKLGYQPRILVKEGIQVSLEWYIESLQ